MIYLTAIAVTCLVVALAHDILKRDDVDYQALVKKYWAAVAGTIVTGVAIWALIEIIS